MLNMACISGTWFHCIIHKTLFGLSCQIKRQIEIIYAEMAEYELLPDNIFVEVSISLPV